MATRLYAGGRCPRCGSSVLTNGAFVWCTYVGDGRPGTACAYGIGVPVVKAEFDRKLFGCAACQDWGCSLCLYDAETVSDNT